MGWLSKLFGQKDEETKEQTQDQNDQAVEGESTQDEQTESQAQ